MLPVTLLPVHSLVHFSRTKDRAILRMKSGRYAYGSIQNLRVAAPKPLTTKAILILE
jgi:hypothetical protein